MKEIITFQDIQKNTEINTYLESGNRALGVMGYTEHSYVHAGRVANAAAKLMTELGFDSRQAELARIAGYMHDLGNAVNRVLHAQTGAVIAFDILRRMGMEPAELAAVIGAIGNHHEEDGCAVSPQSAALIIADKADVRRSRVRNGEFAKFDIHDRVNYAVERSDIITDNVRDTISLTLAIDNSISPPIDFLEIFMTRMTMCRRAADFLGKRFELIINGAKLS